MNLNFTFLSMQQHDRLIFFLVRVRVRRSVSLVLLKDVCAEAEVNTDQHVASTKHKVQLTLMWISSAGLVVLNLIWSISFISMLFSVFLAACICVFSWISVIWFCSRPPPGRLSDAVGSVVYTWLPVTCAVLLCWDGLDSRLCGRRMM